VASAIVSGYAYGPPVGVIKMRGLPFSVREGDIAAFLHGLRLTREMIHIVYMPDGRTTGECFVELASEEEMASAMAKNRERIGARWIELFRSNADEMNVAMRRAAAGAMMASAAGGMGAAYGGGAAAAMGGYGGGYGAPAMAAAYGGGYGAGMQSTPATDPAYHDVFLRLRGLPFSANEQDIMTFFAAAQLAPIGIQMMMNAQGRKSGEAFVQFGTSEEARRGMGLHRGSMGTRYIEIFHCTAAEVMAAVSAQQQMQAAGAMGGMGGMHGGYGAPGMPGGYDYPAKRGRYE
jgi:heterogeneous nuclear ribonucleoprotein F/H